VYGRNGTRNKHRTNKELIRYMTLDVKSAIKRLLLKIETDGRIRVKQILKKEKCGDV
jgi:hypothetical protein